MLNLDQIKDIVGKLGYSLDSNQPHLSDEGIILMRDKRVLIGRDGSGNKVVIKISDSEGGRNEITKEEKVENELTNAPFSRERILFPKKLFYDDAKLYTIRVTQFIDQEQVFAALPLEDQFFSILKEFETEEGFYANTFEHLDKIRNTFPITSADKYIENFRNFDIKENRSEALALLEKNRDLIGTRSNYLTHTDFAPSNFRIHDGKIYMLDLSSIHFANRYEGLARLLNWCVIHDPKLGEMLVEYIRENRGKEEYLCLRLMRIYKAGLLLNHYNNLLTKVSGDLKVLTVIRIDLWNKIMESLLKDSPIQKEYIENYRNERNKLRSKKETERQKEFNLVNV